MSEDVGEATDQHSVATASYVEHRPRSSSASHGCWRGAS